MTVPLHARIVLLSALVACPACVDITDLRNEGEDVPPSGQVDTGWVPDTFSHDLPSQPCDVDGDCGDWLQGNPCLVATCESGQCAAAPVGEGVPCSDGDPGTRGDRCAAGACQPGPAVCVCSTDAECDAFDDGNQCNGRLSCDGCACLAMETPPGTPCNDANPATVDDACVDEDTCRGEIPCQCESEADCPTQTCTETLCVGCQCRIYSGIAGTIYEDVVISEALPDGWTVSSDNEQVTWRPVSGGGLRASGPDGTYDHGAAVAELVAAPVPLPPGAALLRADVGLLSAEDGCDDRLEIYVGDTLLERLCGPTEVATRSWPVAGGQSAVLRAVFTTDDDDNAAAGAFLGALRWIRSQPNNCAPPSAEQVLPTAPAGPQTWPDVSPTGDGFFAVWQGEGGVYRRPLDAQGDPGGTVLLLDADGAHPAAGDGWVVWERGAVIVLKGEGPEQVLEGDAPAAWPDVAGAVPTVVYLADAPAGPTARRWSGGATTDLATSEDLYPPRVAHDDGPWVVLSDQQGVRLVAPDDTTATLSTAQSTSRPDVAAGHGRVVAAWTGASGVLLATDTSEEPLAVSAPGARDPALVATSLGWVVAWINGTGEDSGLAATAFVPDLSLSTPMSAPNSYLFGSQDQIRLAPLGGGALAVWRTDWFDGDASSVVVRPLAFPLQ